MELKDLLPLVASTLTLLSTGFLGIWQRRQAHRLDAITAAFQAEIDLYRTSREAAIAGHRTTLERKLTDIRLGISEAQRLKDAASFLLEAADRPNVFPRAAAILEFKAASEAVEVAHRALTQWYSLTEMMPFHRCKSMSAPLTAIVSSQVEGGAEITSVPDEVRNDLHQCRDFAKLAQDQLRAMAASSEFLLSDAGNRAPRLMG